MTLSGAQLDYILNELQECGSSTADFIISLLQNEQFAHHSSVEEIVAHLHEILHAMRGNKVVQPHLLEWAHDKIKKNYASQIATLVRSTTGFQFHARKATTEKLQALNIENIASQMSELAPGLWDLIGVLLQVDPDQNKRRMRDRAWHKAKKKGIDNEGDIIMAMEDNLIVEDNDNTYWEDVDEIEDIFNSDLYHQLASEADQTVQASANDKDQENEEQDAEEKLEELEDKQEALMTICEMASYSTVPKKKIVCISIMMHSTNQRCNALQTLLGIFLHACNAPQTIIEFMAHLGVSISTTAINSAISNLSKESARELKRLGRTLLTAYAYDNIDMDLKHTVPTIEHPSTTLIHLTSVTLIPLEHGIKKEYLDCSRELWEKSVLNCKHSRTGTESREREVNNNDFAWLHQEAPHPSGLTCREHFNAWVFRQDLVEHGPEAFHHHKKSLGHPEVVEQIPIVKSSQAWVGNPNEDPDVTDIGNHVVLVFRDLGVGERVQSVLASQADESTPWQRMQFIVYVLGLFHVTMACADAIWQMFISKKECQNESDEHSLMKHVSILRPKETRKIETKPGFRCMHEIIQHNGIVTRLECWCLEAMKLGYTSLEEFVASNPTWEQLQKLSEKMEIMNKINEGDVGGVEACFLLWTWLFQACEKHKYAMYMRKYLRDVHFVYPVDLKRAVHMSILVNPTGKREKFRGVDWWVELNNLYSKFAIPDYLDQGQHLATTGKQTKIRGEYYDGGDWDDVIGDEDANIEELGDLEIVDVD
ncbi:hypothetical protein DXG01_011522 [Tephrocybe rancida]|nr:hypothetical protein DXG01_011522 [Tephrocybe rancida]